MTATKDTAELQRLFDTGAHFAQVKSRRHPSMKPYLVGSKGRQEIIDLTKTAEQIKTAKVAMETLAKEGKTILFVGGKVETSVLLKDMAHDIGAPYVATRWLGGTISNWSEIKKRIARLNELTDVSTENGNSTTGKQYTKLELLKIDREKNRLIERLDGLTTLTKHPDALVVIDTKREKYAVKEANDAGIPIIAIMSSDCDIKGVSYPIVANDASRDTVKLILGDLVEAFKKGQKV